jgi:hypothetical protein
MSDGHDDIFNNALPSPCVSGVVGCWQKWHYPTRGDKQRNALASFATLCHFSSLPFSIEQKLAETSRFLGRTPTDTKSARGELEVFRH